MASQNPDHAWIPTYRTPEEVATPTVQNRWVGFPYTKYMNANDNIDGAASWLMCSVGTAKRLGIPEEKWVYQHSGAHCHEGTEQVSPECFAAWPRSYPHLQPASL